MAEEYRIGRKRGGLPPEDDKKATAADRLAKLASSDPYLRAAEAGAVPEEETRNWVLFGNAALPNKEQT